MTNKEILKKAIKKAAKNGFDDTDITKVDDITIADNVTYFGLYIFWHGDQAIYYGLNDIIFSHKFAKAFFGSRMVSRQVIFYTSDSTREKIEVKMKAWEYFLQEMVLYQNPLEYLGSFL